MKTKVSDPYLKAKGIWLSLGLLTLFVIGASLPLNEFESFLTSEHLQFAFGHSEASPETVRIQVDPMDFSSPARLREIREHLLAHGATSVWFQNSQDSEHELQEQLDKDGILRSIDLSKASSIVVFLQSMGKSELFSAYAHRRLWLNFESAWGSCRYSKALKLCPDLKDKIAIVLSADDLSRKINTSFGHLSASEAFSQTVEQILQDKWGVRPTRLIQNFSVLFFAVLLVILFWRVQSGFTLMSVFGLSLVFNLVFPQISIRLFQMIPESAGGFSMILFWSLSVWVRSQLKIDQERKSQQKTRDFILSVSHELKTPLAKLFLNIDELKKHPEMAPLLNSVQNSATELKGQIDSLLQLANSQWESIKSQNEICSVNELVRQTAATYESLFKQKNLSLSLNLGPVFNIRSDSRQICLILSNLMSNTWKHAPAGSFISIETHETATHVEIQYSDWGLSAYMQNQDSTQMVQQNGTSGHGIELCRKLAKSLGGQFEFGTPCRISLPTNPPLV